MRKSSSPHRGRDRGVQVGFFFFPSGIQPLLWDIDVVAGLASLDKRYPFLKGLFFHEGQHLLFKK